MKQLRPLLLLLLLMQVICSAATGQVTDTTQTRSLDDEDYVDSTDAMVDTSVVYGDSEEEYDEEADTSFGDFGTRFSLKQPDTLSSVRSFPPTAVSNIKQDEDFWYINQEFKKKEEAVNNSSDFWQSFFKILGSSTAQAIIWTLMIGTLVVVFIMYLVNNRIGFGSHGKRIQQQVAQGELPENIFDIDFNTHINKAVAENNYRLATRLFFLRMLKTMSEKSLLRYEKDKTNMDYLLELNGSAYFKDFAAAARNYEYVWYGNFTISQQQFAAIQGSFEKFN
ncbi:DUF4129 domain-containing protein [Foetidibacter luteolus]|uniref:DUF4129 domain-containing protein n=1 Tax=Foetidibacter luteolus TaxID=2608880 RepID=UPI00129BD4FE|nr:DUF4129 domain-containing protein [Foetidibacter luteolus]